jgi:hypothetical protein
LLVFRSLTPSICMHFLQFICCLYIVQGLSLLIFGWFFHLYCKVWVICSFYFSLMYVVLMETLLHISQENITSCSNTTFHNSVHFTYTRLMKQVDKWGNQQNQFHILNCYTYINCYIQLGLWKHSYTYRDTIHSDMKEVCTNRTELGPFRTYPLVGTLSKGDMNYSYQSTITEISKSQNSSISELFCGQPL